MRTRTILSMTSALLSLLILGTFDLDGQTGEQKGKAAPAKTRFKLGPVTGSAENGRKLFYNYTCYGCHGFNGETGARDLVGTDSPILANEDTFTLFLRQRGDRAPVLPTQTMPNYPENTLSNKDAKDIYAYIRSFHLDAPKVEDVPALRKILEDAKKPYTPN